MDAPAFRVEAIERTDIWAYRPFIDGLRAVSIIAVVAYHLGVPGFDGGFVGVDIFFVISGYLIIGQIVAGLEAGKFSFAAFWARRVLRILPPYLLVIAACFVLAPFVLVTPGEFEELGWEAFYSGLMVVNHYFLANEGYFDKAAHLKPLLHLWTLAVEEQFYVVAPVLLFVLWQVVRFFRRARSIIWTLVPAIVFVASLIGCIVYTSKRPEDNYAFFLMPFRAWEFIAGGALGVLAVTVRRLPREAFLALAVLGAAMILASVLFLQEGSYPGAAALLPVGGGCAVILAGLAWPGNPVARFLSTTPMVGIGLISYAWYLWHWPLLSFMRLYNFGERRFAADLVAVVLSFALAVLTHLYVERPVRAWRKRNWSTSRGWPVVAAGVVTACLIALGGYGFANIVAPGVDEAIADSLYPGRNVHSPTACIVTGRGSVKPGRLCKDVLLGENLGAMLGDSHALANFDTLREVVKDDGGDLVLLWGAGCLPVMDFGSTRRELDRWKCRRVMLSALTMLLEKWRGKIDFAVLDGRWSAFSELPGHNGQAKLESLHRDLSKTIDLMTKAGISRILIMGPSPIFLHVAKECVLRADYFGMSRDYCGQTRKYVEEDIGAVTEVLRKVSAEHPNARFIDLIDVFCDQEFCRPYDGDVLLYKDTDHVSPMGALRIHKTFAQDFEWVTTGKDSPVAATAEPAM